MVGVGIDALVGVMVASMLISLELGNPSLYAVGVLADDWAEAVSDLPIGMRVGEWIDALARGCVDVMAGLNFSMELIDVFAEVWADGMTALNFGSMPASSEERLCLC